MSDDTRLNDPIAAMLRSYAQNILVFIFGLLPLIFIPSIAAPFEYTKVVVVVVGAFAALVLYSLSVLRSGVVTVHASRPLIALWGVAGMALVSSLLSGDLKDSLVGDLFSIHATVFVAILALVPTVWMLLRASKASVMKMYILLAVSTLVLVLFHVLRLVFGPEFLSFGIFTDTVSTPVGSWNDLALFLGITVILSLVALEQLSLTKVGKWLFVIVSIASLLMLGVINFFTVWVVLGVTSLVMVVYTLGKDRFRGEQLPLMNAAGASAPNGASFAVALTVFAVSVLFVIGGASLGGWLAQKTGVSYVEVRPSLEATADIARNVYRENAFLGIGTNKFTDAWRLYKDNSINTTPFWNTEFNAGSGYIATFFVTTGVLGGIAWTIFLVLYIRAGVTRLLGSASTDKMWYFIGVSSFVSALYVWGMALVYVPGVVILLFGALCTGVSLHAFSVLGGQEGQAIAIGSNRRSGFVLVLAVIVCIVVSVSALYGMGRHYASVYAFNESVRLMGQNADIGEQLREVENAYRLIPNDVYARRIALFARNRMQTLASLPEPTEQDKTNFRDASVMAIQYAEEATAHDESEPLNWAVRGGIYAMLAQLPVEGARDRALEMYAKYRELDPKNPLPFLESAIVEAQGGNPDSARAYINQSIAIKPNFTDAFFYLSQLEIAQGNVDAAVQSTLATISLEPQNPTRYYQLGVLESSRRNVEAAARAFETAVQLDQNYANARYLLALVYDELGRSGDAKAQLQKVLELNPGNADVEALLNMLNSEGSLENLRASAGQTVSEQAPVTEENGTVRTTGDSETDLVTPVNTVPATEDEEVSPAPETEHVPAPDATPSESAGEDTTAVTQ